MNADLPKISQSYLRFFRSYTRRFLTRHFHAVRLSRAVPLPRDGERSLIIYLNHSAWWDPLICLFLAEISSRRARADGCGAIPSLSHPWETRPFFH